MNYLKVIAGEIKGKKIPFNNSRYSNADITPQKIKGAVFSILGENLHSKSFLDLYSCSGQMGIEALSRGADPVFFNELDKKRYGFIVNYISQLKINSVTSITNFDAGKLLQKLSSDSCQFNYIYLDPPYVKDLNKNNFYESLIEQIIDLNLIAHDGLILVQHSKEITITELENKYEKSSLKIYGSSALSSFKNIK